jgi:hypothetical protein
MKHIIKGAMLALVVALAMTGQDEPRKTICGLNQQDASPNVALLQVSCVDFDALRAASPSLPWPSGKRTQVLIHARAGEAIKVTIGGVVQLANLTPHADGNLHAMVQFDGIEATDLDVKILTELK